MDVQDFARSQHIAARLSQTMQRLTGPPLVAITGTVGDLVAFSTGHVYTGNAVGLVGSIVAKFGWLADAQMIAVSVGCCWTGVDEALSEREALVDASVITQTPEMQQGLVTVACAVNDIGEPIALTSRASVDDAGTLSFAAYDDPDVALIIGKPLAAMMATAMQHSSPANDEVAARFATLDRAETLAAAAVIARRHAIDATALPAGFLLGVI